MEPIMDRQEIAKAINFGHYPVLSIDMDDMPYGKGFVRGEEVNVAWDKAGYEGMVSECQLVISDGKYKLLGSGVMLKANYNVFDFIDQVKKANNPVVRKGQVVAVAHYSRKSEVFFVRMMRVSDRISIHSQMVAELVDVPDDFKLKEVR